MVFFKKATALLIRQHFNVKKTEDIGLEIIQEPQFSKKPSLKCTKHNEMTCLQMCENIQIPAERLLNFMTDF